jgi:hypothetical protein
MSEAVNQSFLKLRYSWWVQDIKIRSNIKNIVTFIVYAIDLLLNMIL